MQNKLILAFISLMVFVLAGCSEMSLREDFGRSTAVNQKAQLVNPNAGQMQVPTATLDGQKAEKVVKEYRQEKSKAPTESLVK